MMNEQKQNGFEKQLLRSWNVVYPVGIYFVVTALSLVILDGFLPASQKTNLFRQMITSIATIPFLLSFYRQDKLLRWSFFGREKTPVKKTIVTILLVGVMSFCFALAWNNLFGFLQMWKYSPNYQTVEPSFYMGNLMLEIIILGFITPFVEELLYRGIVYIRLREWLGDPLAIMISAMIFGFIHMNLVQGLFAFVFGILLAFFVGRTGKLYLAVTGHSMANLFSVTRKELGWFVYSDSVTIVVTVLGMVAALLCCFIFRKVTLVEENS